MNPNYRDYGDCHPTRTMHAPTRTVAVFFKDGESVVFENVEPESIEYHAPENTLTMVQRGGRDVNVPGVRYWTEDER